MGVIKNRCKNCDHSYVHASAAPIPDESGQIQEIQSVRQQIWDEAIIERAERLYPRLRALEPDGGPVPERLLSRSPSAAAYAVTGFGVGVAATLGALAMSAPGAIEVALEIAGVGPPGAGMVQALGKLRSAASQ